MCFSGTSFFWDDKPHATRCLNVLLPTPHVFAVFFDVFRREPNKNDVVSFCVLRGGESHAKAHKGYYLWARKREMWRKNKTYLIFPAYGNMPNVAPNKPGSFFLANPNIADILREMDFDFENRFGKDKLDRAFFIITNVEKGG